jgi:hypothetical protein
MILREIHIQRTDSHLTINIAEQTNPSFSKAQHNIHCLIVCLLSSIAVRHRNHNPSICNTVTKMQFDTRLHQSKRAKVKRNRNHPYRLQQALSSSTDDTRSGFDVVSSKTTTSSAGTSRISALTDQKWGFAKPTPRRNINNRLDPIRDSPAACLTLGALIESVTTCKWQVVDQEGECRDDDETDDRSYDDTLNTYSTEFFPMPNFPALSENHVLRAINQQLMNFQSKMSRVSSEDSYYPSEMNGSEDLNSTSVENENADQAEPSKQQQVVEYSLYRNIAWEAERQGSQPLKLLGDLSLNGPRSLSVSVDSNDTNIGSSLQHLEKDRLAKERMSLWGAAVIDSIFNTFSRTDTDDIYNIGQEMSHDQDIIEPVKSKSVISKGTDDCAPVHESLPPRTPLEEEEETPPTLQHHDGLCQDKNTTPSSPIRSKLDRLKMLTPRIKIIRSILRRKRTKIQGDIGSSVASSMSSGSQSLNNNSSAKPKDKSEKTTTDSTTSSSFKTTESKPSRFRAKLIRLKRLRLSTKKLRRSQLKRLAQAMTLAYDETQSVVNSIVDPKADSKLFAPFVGGLAFSGIRI